MNNVRLVRLTSGEEVICQVAEAEDCVKMSEGLLLIPREEGKLTFATWLPYNKNDYVLMPFVSILFTVEPVEEMVDNYKKAIGHSLIATPSKKIII